MVTVVPVVPNKNERKGKIKIKSMKGEKSENSQKQLQRFRLFNVPVIESAVALLLFATSVGVHILALHVCKPRPAVVDIVYPVPHAEQSTVSSV